jgi:hypothetical protein
VTGSIALMYRRDFSRATFGAIYDNRSHHRFACGATWRWRWLLRIPPTWITPFAELQAKFARAWLDRMTSSFIMMGTMVLSAQAAAMMPIQETVFANVDR